MVFTSEISFTLDTICPWLDQALAIVRHCSVSEKVQFTVRFYPYQLYPDASEEGEDKYGWYRRTKYDDNDEKMVKYTTLMSDYGRSAGISFKFGGTIANSLPAHRLIQYFQEAPQGSPELADRIVNSLYILYFEQEAHPADDQTLLHAATEAGISLEAAQAAIRNRTEGVQDVKALIREQVGDGVDSVPYIVFEGKKRDFTLVGAQEVGEYVQALEQVAKESE